MVINIPSPKPGESSKEFVSRCIPYLIHEGKHPNTPEGRKAAAGECYGIYRSSKKKSKGEEMVVHVGLKDTEGYFCRLGKDGKKYYYALEDDVLRENAIKNADEDYINWILKEIEVREKPVEKTKPVEYIAPKSKDELRTGDQIIYKGKKAKILKVLEK